MSVAYLNSYREEKTVIEEHGGFARIYRSLSQQPWYKNSAYTHLFIHLLSRATHKQRSVKFHGFSVNLLPGQLATSLNQLSDETGINVQTIRRAIKKFKSLGQISTLNVQNGKGKEVSYTVIMMSSWLKFNQKQQKNDIPNDIPSDIPSDIRESLATKGVECGRDIPSDIPQDTPSDIQNNNYSNNKDNTYVKNASALLVRNIVKSYNESFPELPSVAKITPARKSKLIKIINDKFTVNGNPVEFKTLRDWEGLFAYLQNSNFLMGRSSDWQMTFDFMINSTNFVKIIEGNYDNK